MDIKEHRAAVAVIAIVVLAVFAALFAYSHSSLSANPPPSGTSPTPTNNANSTSTEYWTLNISPATGSNSVSPNGTIQVPMSQDGINVTATPHGWNGFMYWLFDGNRMEDNSSTIFISRQLADSNHTLEAKFVLGTPVINLIGDAQVTVNAGMYQAYSFIIPSGTGKISDIFNATGTIRVYVMDNESFTNWQNGQGANALYSSGQVTEGYINNLTLPTSGTYYLIYDNTNGSTALTVNSVTSYYYIPP